MQVVIELGTKLLFELDNFILTINHMICPLTDVAFNVWGNFS